MKTTWRRKRNNLPIPRRALLVLLVFLLGWGAVSAAKHLLPGVIEQFVAKKTEVTQVSASGLFSFLSVFQDKSDLAARVKRLEDNEVALELQVQSLLYLQDENESLREILSFTPDDGVLASVVAWPPKTAYDTLIIKVTDTVSIGDLVLGRGVVPIGEVSRIEDGFAYVTFLTQGGNISQVRVGDDLLALELLGRGGGSAVIIAPSETPANRGDQVFFPYNGNTFIGQIGAVESDPAASTKNLWVSFPRHFFSYTWVSVVPGVDI